VLSSLIAVLSDVTESFVLLQHAYDTELMRLLLLLLLLLLHLTSSTEGDGRLCFRRHR